MAKILFKGWKIGLKKIALSRLLQTKANLPLKRAKEKTDALLNSEGFVIELDSLEQTNDLVKEATELGAVCEIIKDND